MRTLLLSASAAMLLSACGEPAPDASAAPTVDVAGAFCRPTQAGRDATGCYVTLAASDDDRLVSASSPAAAEVQIHEMTMEGGMMRMGELPDGLPLPAGERVELRPGGNHLMILGLSRPLVEGERLSLTLTFEKAPAQELTFPIGQPAE